MEAQGAPAALVEVSKPRGGWLGGGITHGCWLPRCSLGPLVRFLGGGFTELSGRKNGSPMAVRGSRVMVWWCCGST